MREIKFRAWDKKLKEMGNVLGVYLVDNGWVDIENGKRDDDEEAGVEWRERLTNVILMQYIELKDKNGVEIYEGDIVEYQGTGLGTGKTFGIVKFYPSEGWLYETFGNKVTWQDWKHVIVVGDIYQNKELLNE